MNKSENDILRECCLKKPISQKNEKSLETKENDVKNFENLCLEKELQEKQVSNYYSIRSENNKDKNMELTLLSRLIKLNYKFNDHTLKTRIKLTIFSEKFSLQISGYIFGIIGLLIQFFSTYLAFLLYYAIDPTYSIYNNWISELGIGPNGANIIFCAGWILSSGFLFLFNDHVINILQKKMKKFTRVYPLMLFNFIFTLGIFLVGLFPANLLAQHYIGAVLYFYGGFLFFSYYGIIAIFNREVPRFHGLVSVILSTCFLIFVLSPYFATEFFEFRITTTSAEWSIFIFETSLMLLILKNSMEDNYCLCSSLQGQLFF